MGMSADQLNYIDESRQMNAVDIVVGLDILVDIAKCKQLLHQLCPQPNIARKHYLVPSQMISLTDSDSTCLSLF